MKRNNSLFYCNLENDSEIGDFLLKLNNYAEDNTNGNPVYVINKPLGENKYHYDYGSAAVLLVPKHKIIFINYGSNDEAFEDYVDEFLEDVGHISDRYEYIQVLGRQKQWRRKFVESISFEEIQDREISVFLEAYKLHTHEEERKADFLISLITGSINDIEKTGIEYPETILEQIKRKIILFDGDQTRFIYDEPKKKRITIQGLAGTGKTELLMHKIKELYIKYDDVRIVFTCHNKILAENMKERIPQFFNFMKVDEQIKWQEKLWVMSSWGSKSDMNSGIYSYICNYYNIPFERFSYSITFDEICKRALEHLRMVEHFTPCFDYILIDESQDFTEGFFDLCSKVAKECIYVAGDIFQNIFESEDISEVNPDFLLNKCYRTDPKTLMCAHAIGMGLFENGNRLRWLKDEAWKDCGYDIEKKDGYYDLHRKPLRRFEDIGNIGIKNIEIITKKPGEFVECILGVIEKLKKENPTIEADDIGIMFLENTNHNYSLANQLEIEINERFQWDVNIGYETKEKQKGAVFISNRNNVKGLEFPFVICFMQGKLDRDLRTRNSIYMMLTRSFITSYFIIPDCEETETIEEISSGVRWVNEKGYLHILEPDDKEKKKLNNAIINKTNIYKSQREIIEEIMDEIKVDRKSRDKIRKIINIAHKEEMDRDKLYEIIKVNYSLMG